MFQKALFIGINKYNSKGTPIRDLEGCVDDMLLMLDTVALLADARSNNRGLQSRDITVLVDQQATTSNILNSLEYLVRDIRVGQQVFMYYAGHGGQVPNANYEGSLEGYVKAYNETLVPHDFSLEEPLLDDILYHYVDKVPVGARFILIIDSCHSGGMAAQYADSISVESQSDLEEWQNRSIGRISWSEYSPEEMRKLKEHKKRYLTQKAPGQFVLLAAAHPDEYAWERLFGKQKHGIFTYHVCEGLRERGGSISPMELINYAYSKFAGYRREQMPRLVGNENFFNRPLF